MTDITHRRHGVAETFMRLVAAAFGGASLVIACAGFTAPWRNSTDTPAIALVLLSIPMLLLGAAFSVVAFWEPRELSRRAVVTLIVCEVATFALFLPLVRLFHGPP